MEQWSGVQFGHAASLHHSLNSRTPITPRPFLDHFTRNFSPPSKRFPSGPKNLRSTCGSVKGQ